MTVGIGIFGEWAKVLSAGVEPEARRKIFSNAAGDAAGYVSRGLPKSQAADALWELAQAHGLVAAFGADAIQNIIAEAFENIEPDRVPDDLDEPEQPKPRSNGKANGHAIALPALNPFPIDGMMLPRRPWLIPGLLLRGQLTLLVAPPGSGKSLLTLQLAMVCACGLAEWGGWRPRGRYRTLVINVEEDQTEMKRRLFGAHKIMNIHQDDLADNIFLAEAGSIVVAKADSRTKTVVATPVLDQIVQTIIELKIDIVIVDPFAETFAGDENSNSELKWAGVLWREVARRTNAAVLIVHHAKKYAQNMAGDMDASRGGGALSGVARIVATLFPMTESEFDHYRTQIKKAFPQANRGRFIRFDDAKAQYSLLGSFARWFFKETIGIGNAGDGLPEDEVGVLVPWPTPGLLSDVDPEKIKYVLDEIEVGLRDESGQPLGDPYSPNKAGGNNKRWVGTLLEEHLQVTDKQAKEIINIWLDTGLLVEFKGFPASAKGKERDCLRVDSSKRPGTVTEETAL